MAQKKYKNYKPTKVTSLPFTSINYYLFFLGIVFLIAGYICLSRGPWNSFWSLTLAPILLVIGYCVIIPLAILFHIKNSDKNVKKK